MPGEVAADRSIAFGTAASSSALAAATAAAATTTTTTTLPSLAAAAGAPRGDVGDGHSGETVSSPEAAERQYAVEAREPRYNNNDNDKYDANGDSDAANTASSSSSRYFEVSLYYHCTITVLSLYSCYTITVLTLYYHCTHAILSLY